MLEVMMVLCVLSQDDKPKCTPLMVVDHVHKVASDEECRTLAVDLLAQLKAVRPEVVGELQMARCEEAKSTGSDEDDNST